MMIRYQCRLTLLAIVTVATLPGLGRVAYAREVATPVDGISVVSPDTFVVLKLSTRSTRGTGQSLHYEVTFHGRPVIKSSRLGVRLAGGDALGMNCQIVKHESRRVDESFEQFPGKRRLVNDRCTETTVSLRERGTQGRSWQVVVRTYDDGVAVRYRFPSQAGWDKLEVADERTEFLLPADAVATLLPLSSFTTSHENRYERRPVAEIAARQLIGPPLLIELPGTGWAAIAEANLTDYAGMYLARDDGATLATRLAPRLDEPTVAVRASLPHDSPWRVVLVGKYVEQLVMSDMLLKLNAPRAVDDVSWIKPGMTTFPWWNGYYEEGVPFKPGLNTATAKHYIDFCAEYGIPYHSLDGVGDTAWYSGPIVPYQGADITCAIEGLDLPAVLEYARRKGVRLRLWMHWEAARQHMARAFPVYHKWGIEGVMIDFMDRDDQEMVNFQRELLQLAAKNQLTVTFHGVAAPTGLERTFPHLLTSEAVMNLEYDKWEPQGMSPEHDVTVALTRMLAGPLDYHQGSLRGVPLDKFQARNEAPLVIGTPCRMLAMYVVYQNHLAMMADYPTAYRRHPLTKVIAETPSSWDDTQVLSAIDANEVVIARRRGDAWWLGALTNRAEREVQISLSFLDAGKYRAEIYEDDLAQPHRFAERGQIVVATDALRLRLAPAGGACVRLTKVK